MYQGHQLQLPRDLTSGGSLPSGHMQHAMSGQPTQYRSYQLLIPMLVHLLAKVEVLLAEDEKASVFAVLLSLVVLALVPVVAVLQADSGGCVTGLSRCLLCLPIN